MTVATSTSSNGPIGTVLGPGSTSLRLTDREGQVMELIGFGHSYKKIGSELEISAGSVAVIASHIASRIPGNGSPLVKICAWSWTHGQAASEAP